MQKVDLKNGIFKGKPMYLVAILVLAAALILSLLGAVTIGSVDLEVGEVYRVILYKLFGIGDPAVYGSGSMSDIVWFVRLPRLVLAIAIGCSLSIAGVVMQAIVKNPLADPYVLGISSGASLGATLAILLGVGAALGNGYIGIMAFLGAFGVSMGVIFLANIGGRANSVKLILAGTALSSICSAVSNFVLFVKNNSSGAVNAAVRWTMGSLAAAEWETNGMLLVISALGVLFFWSQYRTLNLMLLGDESAITLGTDLHRWRILYLIVASLMVGFAVYAAGVIGFVGLVIPHVVRMLFGTDHKKLIPLSALLGALFLLWADVLCRTLIDRAELQKCDVLTALHRMEGQKPFDVIFMDPPYDQGLERQVMEYLTRSSLADEYTVIVIEASLETDFSWLEAAGFHAYKYKKYKTNQHVFIQRNDA